MRSFKNQAGFSIIEVAVVIVVVCIGGLVGYTAYSRLQDKTTNSSAQVTTSNAVQSPIAIDIATPPVIATTTDLTTAAKVLDDTNIDNTSDSTQLDTQLSDF